MASKVTDQPETLNLREKHGVSANEKQQYSSQLRKVSRPDAQALISYSGAGGPEAPQSMASQHTNRQSCFKSGGTQAITTAIGWSWSVGECVEAWTSKLVIVSHE